MKQKNRPASVFDGRANQADIHNPLCCLIQLKDRLLFRAEYCIMPITVSCRLLSESANEPDQQNSQKDRACKPHKDQKDPADDLENNKYHKK